MSEPETLRTWQPVDLTDVLAGNWTAPEATVGARSDDVGLFYPGKCHTISSESEAGKTWLVLAAVQVELNRGSHVVYIDFEDDVGPIVGRLIMLGCDPEKIRNQFHYVRPEGPLGEVPNKIDLADLMRMFRPSLAVIDGVTEGMTLHGLNPLDNADAARFGRMLPRTLAEWGAAVVSLDHVTKSAEGRGRYSIGAVHKLNGLDGAAFILENRTAFGVGLVGRSTVKITKDRPGQLRKHAAPSSQGMHWFADLVLDASINGHVNAVIEPPKQDATDATEAPPTFMMQRVTEKLSEHPEGLSQRVLCDVVKGKAVTIRSALSHLIAGGYVTDKTPHRLVKPYTNGGEGK